MKKMKLHLAHPPKELLGQEIKQLLKEKQKRDKRQKMINALIEDDVNTIIDSGERAYLVDILRDGFCGYNKYTNKELVKEYQERIIEEAKLDQ